MQPRDYRAIIIVGLGLGFAILTGFARQAAVAHELGVSRVADVFLVAYAIPEFIYIAFPIILTPVFIPIFSRVRQAQGEFYAWQFSFRVAQVLGLILIAITVLIALGGPYFLLWMSPGFTPAERQQALSAFFPMLPSILLIGMATLFNSISQIYRHFFRPMFMTAIYNLVFIAVLFFMPIPQALMRASWGVTIGAAIALLFLLPPINRWMPAQVFQQVNHASILPIREWMTLTGPMALGYATHHLILFIDRAMATGLGVGSVAALNYADHLTMVVVQLSGLAVSTVLFPNLTDQVAGGDMTMARRSLSNALLLVWRIALPASAGLILLRTPVIQVLFEHGAFDTQATSLVSTPVIWYSIAVLADSLCQPLWRAVYAKQGVWTVFKINSFQTGIRLIANITLIPWLGYIGLALSATIGLTLQVVALARWTKSRFGFKLNSSNWREILQTTVGTFLALIASDLLYNAAKTNRPILIILACSICGSLIYFLYLYGSKNLRSIFYGR